MTAEERRLREARRRTAHWKRWGPYLSERAWGTVREDYSAGGTPWEYFPHDHARSRAYRWNEDGLAGICDRHQRICFALALWNERDPILKERLFGLNGHEGNHGEDVKEYYFYLDNTPTHSYMKFLYKYPQTAFPYSQLVEENRRRGRGAGEFELLDTGVFSEDRYFDVLVEYAKADVEDMLIRISITNRGPDAARAHVLPTLWFRNTWSWDGEAQRPSLRAEGRSCIEANEPYYGQRWLRFEGSPALLFADNDTNSRRLYGLDGPAYPKDAINDYVVHGAREAVNPASVGTKAAAHYVLTVGPGETAIVRARLSDHPGPSAGGIAAGFDDIVALRRSEADDFYRTVIPASLDDDARNVMRQAFAGLLWSKQFYHYVVESWLSGDAAQPMPHPARRLGRNREWPHLYNADVLSMPDKWEYPWYAAWDLAFHCIPLALVDADLAKEQLVLLLREWYMHPNGQLPAYEWALGDVNPPVHAWAAWHVYKLDEKRTGRGDHVFLERVFHKLLLNFTWWVNRKDRHGTNVFEGGFLGLDNIGLFDRSQPLPTGGHLEQSDGTSWMAMYTLNMLTIALELARTDPVYEDVATKFGEHFVYIAHAMNNVGHDRISLWDDVDGFYYDVIHLPDCRNFPLKIRSLVGLIPLFAVATLDRRTLEEFPAFKARLTWFIDHRSDLTRDCVSLRPGPLGRHLLSVVGADRLRRLLAIMLDESEFLTPYGIRSVSRRYRERPYTLTIDGQSRVLAYEPAESANGLFGGNSNWRGPIWFPLNYLIIESLQRFHGYFGDEFTVECPAGSGRRMTLREVAAELARRLSSIFLTGQDGRRPVYGHAEQLQSDPYWRDAILFYEYFHGDTGEGLGASHQTGWTALVAALLQQR